MQRNADQSLRSDIQELRAVAVLAVIIFHVDRHCFYSSRVRRIVPTYLVMLAIVSVCMVILLVPEWR